MVQVQVLGTGCPKCVKLASATEDAARQLQMDVQIEKVTDIDKIMSYGVMMTPALVVNGAVKVVGKVPSVDELKTLLSGE
ncbi:MAG: thioredoxin family protein [Candidatus Zixiibacteriota bacterium]